MAKIDFYKGDHHILSWNVLFQPAKSDVDADEMRTNCLCNILSWNVHSYLVTVTMS